MNGNTLTDRTGMAFTYKHLNLPRTSVNYYDDFGRLIQSKASNHLGGTDQVNNDYNFVGELVSATRIHAGPGGQQVTVTDRYVYDHGGRLLETRQQIGSQEEITLASYAYNELGQLVDKKLHRRPGQTKYLQSIDYRYNERGWLRAINDPGLVASSAFNDGDADSNPDLFGMELAYNTAPEAPQYNGNIAAMQWKTSKVPAQSVAPPQMGYRYRYDDLQRMTAARSEKNGTLDNAHSEYLQYDINGNINRQGRYAFTGNAKRQIDSLVYSYNGYRSTKIDDSSTEAAAVKNLGYHDKVQQAVEHTYDANGNMTGDLGKGISITYTRRNMPRTITFGTNHKLDFVYDHTGKKLRATYTNGSATYRIDYVDGIRYEQNQLAYVHTAEGRARKNGSTYTYEYDLKDHLGSVRVTFRPDPGDETQTTAQVLQQNSYYAYGMPMYGDAANGLHLAYVSGEKSTYLYSDKELYEQGGLNWFDHGSRFYDPATGRWSVTDPAEQVNNPYLAMGNNPVVFVDPDGEWIHIVVGAVIGGVVNLATHWNDIKDWKDGAAAFGIGAAAGAVTAATGGAAAGLVGVTSTSVVSGFVGGAAGSLSGNFVQGLGNAMYFGDPFEPDPVSGLKTALIGGVAGAAFNGLSNLARGYNWWTGRPSVIPGMPRMQDGLVLDKNPMPNAADYADDVAEGGVEITKHAAQRMAERGITQKMVETGISKGIKYLDPKNGTYNYILKNGFASGKDLLIGVSPQTGKVTTVIRGNNLVNSRFIPQ